MLRLKVKNYLASLLLLFVLSGSGAYAAGYDFLKQSGAQNTGQKAGFDTVQTTTVNGIISQVILVLLGLVAIIFFALLIYGGLTWMTARDNADKVKKANSIIMEALIGLIITLSAYAISYFITLQVG